MGTSLFLRVLYAALRSRPLPVRVLARPCSQDGNAPAALDMPRNPETWVPTFSPGFADLRHYIKPSALQPQTLQACKTSGS